jgi:hypothetical protein
MAQRYTQKRKSSSLSSSHEEFQPQQCDDSDGSEEAYRENKGRNDFREHQTKLRRNAWAIHYHQLVRHWYYLVRYKKRSTVLFFTASGFINIVLAIVILAKDSGLSLPFAVSLATWLLFLSVAFAYVVRETRGVANPLTLWMRRFSNASPKRNPPPHEDIDHRAENHYGPDTQFDPFLRTDGCHVKEFNEWPTYAAPLATAVYTHVLGSSLAAWERDHDKEVPTSHTSTSADIRDARRGRRLITQLRSMWDTFWTEQAKYIPGVDQFLHSPHAASGYSSTKKRFSSSGSSSSSNDHPDAETK